MTDDAKKTDKAATPTDKPEVSDLPQKPISDADAKSVKGGMTNTGKWNS